MHLLRLIQKQIIETSIN